MRKITTCQCPRVCGIRSISRCCNTNKDSPYNRWDEAFSNRVVKLYVSQDLDCPSDLRQNIGNLYWTLEVQSLRSFWVSGQMKLVTGRLVAGDHNRYPMWSQWKCNLGPRHDTYSYEVSLCKAVWYFLSQFRVAYSQATEMNTSPYLGTLSSPPHPVKESSWEPCSVSLQDSPLL